MNFKSFFFIILLSLCFFACEDEEGMIIYPQKYIFTGVEDSDEAAFFEYDNGTFRQVFPTDSSFADLSLLAEELYGLIIDSFYVMERFEEIELLSDSTVRVLLKEQNQVYEDIYEYELNDESLIITIDSIGQFAINSILELENLTEEDKLLFGYMINTVTSYNPATDRLSTIFNFEPSPAIGQTAILDEIAASRIATEYPFKDTMLLRLLYAQYELEE